MRRLNRDTLHGSDQVQPGQRLSLAPTQWDVPDGDRRWSDGPNYCHNQRLPEHSSAPAPGVELRVKLLNPPLDTKFERIRLVVHNRSEHRRRFELTAGNGMLVPANSSATAVMTTGVLLGRLLDIPAGESRHVDASVATFVCGDTQYLNHRLPDASYQLHGMADWRLKSGGRLHGWVTPPRNVRVARGS